MSGIAGLCGECIFNFMRCCQTFSKLVVPFYTLASNAPHSCQHLLSVLCLSGFGVGFVCFSHSNGHSLCFFVVDGDIKFNEF